MKIVPKQLLNSKTDGDGINMSSRILSLLIAFASVFGLFIKVVFL